MLQWHRKAGKSVTSYQLPVTRKEVVIESYPSLTGGWTLAAGHFYWFCMGAFTRSLSYWLSVVSSVSTSIEMISSRFPAHFSHKKASPECARQRCIASAISLDTSNVLVHSAHFSCVFICFQYLYNLLAGAMDSDFTGVV